VQPKLIQDSLQLGEAWGGKVALEVLQKLRTLNDSIPLIETIEALRMIDAPSGMSGSAFCTENSRPLTLPSNALSEGLGANS
jgi:hypothetical protein